MIDCSLLSGIEPLLRLSLIVSVSVFLLFHLGAYNFAGGKFSSVRFVLGPIFQIVSSLMVLGLLFSFYGLPTIVDSGKIGTLVRGSPAAGAGFEVDDVITHINGKPFSNWAEYRASHPIPADKTYQFKLLRKTAKGNSIETVSLTDLRRDSANQLLAFGAVGDIERRMVSVPEALKAALNLGVMTVSETASAIFGLPSASFDRTEYSLPVNMSALNTLVIAWLVYPEIYYPELLALGIFYAAMYTAVLGALMSLLLFALPAKAPPWTGLRSLAVATSSAVAAPTLTGQKQESVSSAEMGSYKLLACLGLLLTFVCLAVSGETALKAPVRVKDDLPQPVISRCDIQIKIDVASNSLIVMEDFEIDNASGAIPHGFKRFIPSRRPADRNQIDFVFDNVELIESQGESEISKEIQFIRQNEFLRVGTMASPLPRKKLHYRFKYKVKNALTKNNQGNILRWYGRPPGLPWKINQLKLNLVSPTGVLASELAAKARIRSIRRKEIQPGEFGYVVAEKISPFETETGLLISPPDGLAAHSDLGFEVIWPT